MVCRKDLAIEIEDGELKLMRPELAGLIPRREPDRMNSPRPWMPGQ